MGDHLAGAKDAGQDRRRDHGPANPEQTAHGAGCCPQYGEPWPAITHLRRSRCIGGEHAGQVVEGQRDQERDEADPHAVRVDPHGPDRTKPGKAETHGSQRQDMAQFNAIALVIAPQREHHVGHHHDQRRTLGQLLVEAEPDAQHRNGNQAATDPEQSPKVPNTAPNTKNSTNSNKTIPLSSGCLSYAVGASGET